MFQFSLSVMSHSLRSHELQRARPPCPSPTHGVHSNPCALSPWCHPAISSSVIPFSFCRPPCPSPTRRVHSNPCALSQWCHPAISSSVIPYSFCPQSLPASESLPMSQLLAWGGQSIGVSALASVLPMTYMILIEKLLTDLTKLLHHPTWRSAIVLIINILWPIH